MDLRRIRHFVVLAETLNFRRAAERLHMAQPPLTVSIQKLETELGTRLFDRGPGGVSLTPAGQAVLVEARKLLFHGAQVGSVARNATGRHRRHAAHRLRRHQHLGHAAKAGAAVSRRAPRRGTGAARGHHGGDRAAAGGPGAGRRPGAHAAAARHRLRAGAAGARQLHRRPAARACAGRPWAAAPAPARQRTVRDVHRPGRGRPAQRRHAGLPARGLRAARRPGRGAGADRCWRWWKAGWAWRWCPR